MMQTHKENHTGENGGVAGSTYDNCSSSSLSSLPLPLHPSPPPVGIVNL